MPEVPATGSTAPDFTLPGVVDRERAHYTLSEQRGHPVVLAFYPGDETAVCTKQLCSYQHELSSLTDLDATLWGISSQGISSHEKFQANRGLGFPLLADQQNEVFAKYGLGLGLTRRRAVFVIDADGRIAWSHVAKLGLTYQNAETIAGVLRGLAPTAA
jgi:thioredoxin-dependent peroxiredoxin